MAYTRGLTLSWPLIDVGSLLYLDCTQRCGTKGDSKEENVNVNTETNFRNSYGLYRQKQAVPGSQRVWSQRS